MYLSPSQYLKLGLMYGMVAVKHTFGLQENGRGAEAYMAENSTMEIIYTPAFRFALLWLPSPGGTCNSDEVGLGALQFLERWRLSGKR